MSALPDKMAAVLMHGFGKSDVLKYSTEVSSRLIQFFFFLKAGFTYACSITYIVRALELGTIAAHSSCVSMIPRYIYDRYHGDIMIPRYVGWQRAPLDGSGPAHFFKYSTEASLRRLLSILKKSRR